MDIQARTGKLDSAGLLMDVLWPPTHDCDYHDRKPPPVVCKLGPWWLFCTQRKRGTSED